MHSRRKLMIISEKYRNGGVLKAHRDLRGCFDLEIVPARSYSTFSDPICAPHHDGREGCLGSAQPTGQ